MKTKNHFYFDQIFVDLLLKFVHHFQFVLNEISKKNKNKLKINKNKTKY